jgi:hypothetical protein
LNATQNRRDGNNEPKETHNMDTIETATETRGLDTSGIWEREYDRAKRSWPDAGPECWQWYADEYAQAARDGYASVAG